MVLSSLQVVEAFFVLISNIKMRASKTLKCSWNRCILLSGVRHAEDSLTLPPALPSCMTTQTVALASSGVLLLGLVRLTWYSTCAIVERSAPLPYARAYWPDAHEGPASSWSVLLADEACTTDHKFHWSIASEITSHLSRLSKSFSSILPVTDIWHHPLRHDLCCCSNVYHFMNEQTADCDGDTSFFMQLDREEKKAAVYYNLG